MWQPSLINRAWPTARPEAAWAAVDRSDGLSPAKVWGWVTTFLVIGYLSMGRSFAYVGLEPVKVFIGEVALGAFLLLRPREVFSRLASALLERSPLSLISWAFYLLLCYGVMQVLRGILIGHPPLTAVQNLAFNYYPFYLFLGLYAGRQKPHFLPTLIRRLAWFVGVYGVAANVYLGQLEIFIPFTKVGLFGLPTGTGVALLGLLCFETNLRRGWPLLLLTAFALLLRMMRSEWVATVGGLLVLGFLTRRLGRTLGGLAAVGVLLVAVMVSGITLPGNRSSFSGENIKTLLIGMAGTQVAEGYVEDEKSMAAAGTVEWRKKWWEGIWNGVLRDTEHSLVGFGYGFALNTLGPHLGGEGETTRTPHNIFYYVLGYTGWIGVSLFLAFQLAVAWALYRAFRQSGQPFGLVLHAVILVMALFGNLLETPFGAIPFYLLVGLTISHGDATRK
jgi:hypothetical protein